MEHTVRALATGQLATRSAEPPERWPLCWAVPAICGLALLGWAAVLTPIVLLLHD